MILEVRGGQMPGIINQQALPKGSISWHDKQKLVSLECSM